MDKILTWSLLVPVAGYWFLMLSRFRFMVGLQSGYHLLFLSLLSGIVSMTVVAVGVALLLGSELSFPVSTEEFFFVWVIDIALITLLFGTTYLIENRLMSRKKITKRELKIANRLGEKIICFLGEAMANYDIVQLSLGNGRTCIGVVTKVPTPLPVWGVASIKKEVSILLAGYEFHDPATGKITKTGTSEGEHVSEKDRVEIHIPLDRIEFAGLYRLGGNAREREDG